MVWGSPEVWGLGRRAHQWRPTSSVFLFALLSWFETLSSGQCPPLQDGAATSLAYHGAWPCPSRHQSAPGGCGLVSKCVDCTSKHMLCGPVAGPGRRSFPHSIHSQSLHAAAGVLLGGQTEPIPLTGIRCANPASWKCLQGDAAIFFDLPCARLERDSYDECPVMRVVNVRRFLPDFVCLCNTKEKQPGASRVWGPCCTP